MKAKWRGMGKGQVAIPKSPRWSRGQHLRIVDWPDQLRSCHHRSRKTLVEQPSAVLTTNTLTETQIHDISFNTHATIACQYIYASKITVSTCKYRRRNSWAPTSLVRQTSKSTRMHQKCCLSKTHVTSLRGQSPLYFLKPMSFKRLRYTLSESKSLKTRRAAVA